MRPLEGITVLDFTQAYSGPYCAMNLADYGARVIKVERIEQGAFTGASGNGKIGLFELADRGTLFLDEVGELSVQMQSKLLRVLQDKEVRRVGGERSIHIDIRIIASSWPSLRYALRSLYTFPPPSTLS